VRLKGPENFRTKSRFALYRDSTVWNYWSMQNKKQNFWITSKSFLVRSFHKLWFNGHKINHDKKIVKRLLLIQISLVYDLYLILLISYWSWIKNSKTKFVYSSFLREKKPYRASKMFFVKTCRIFVACVNVLILYAEKFSVNVRFKCTFIRFFYVIRLFFDVFNLCVLISQAALICHLLYVEFSKYFCQFNSGFFAFL
jgi:hypothetical protein